MLSSHRLQLLLCRRQPHGQLPRSKRVNPQSPCMSGHAAILPQDTRECLRSLHRRPCDVVVSSDKQKVTQLRDRF